MPHNAGRKALKVLTSEILCVGQPPPEGFFPLGCGGIFFKSGGKGGLPPPADEMEWYEQRARARGIDISAFK